MFKAFVYASGCICLVLSLFRISADRLYFRGYIKDDINLKISAYRVFPLEFQYANAAAESYYRIGDKKKCVEIMKSWARNAPTRYNVPMALYHCTDDKRYLNYANSIIGDKLLARVDKIVKTRLQNK